MAVGCVSSAAIDAWRSHHSARIVGGSARVVRLEYRPKRRPTIPEAPTDARNAFGDLAPDLAEITDTTLFGRIWQDPALSPRDRSLVTITSLIAQYRTNEMPFHFKRALENGVTQQEIIATITHLAFYAGWPPAMTALGIARTVFAEAADASA